ncbi:MAG TPA: secretin N-terminal domain-containing protein [Terriglobia bacterium]|nr:secretin N-terminal domain-containing protein [Terriglobia bacterium]
MLSKGIRLIGVLALLTSCLSCGGGSTTAYTQGRKAEERKDWDTALVDYEKAKESDPANALYVLHERNARLNASMLHLKNGRQMLKEGRMDEAAGEFQKASRIDPTNKAAAQELDAVLTKQAQAKKEHTEAIQKALKAREEPSQTAGVKLQPLPQEPIHLKVTVPADKVYQVLAKLAGINVVFTSDFRPTAPLSEDLNGVKIEDALKIVAMQSKSFWRPITPNTILVVADNPTNRRDFDEAVVKTIYLSNPLAPADRTALLTTLKQVLNLQHIMDNPDANAIIIRDSPANVAAAEQLVRELDRSKAEIMIDISIVEADRDRIRNLGLTPATFNSSGTPTPGFQAGAGFAPTSSSSGTTTTVTSAAINTLTWKDYAVVLPGAAAQAVLNDNKTHILQNPQVRVTDGGVAKLKIGTKIPYATGSFLPSLGGTTSSSGGVGLLASTQFTFQDVGVNLELTPHLLQTGEVAVHCKIEISSLGASISVGGITEPTFGQRVLEDDFRLEEGEVNLLGGLIQRTLTQSVQGIPGLGDIPLIRYLFSDENKEVNDQEVLVMLTPRVIRLPEPGRASASTVPVGSLGEERPGGLEGPRPFQNPVPEPPQP